MILQEFFKSRLYDGLTDHGEVRPSETVLRALTRHLLDREPWEFLKLALDTHETAHLASALVARMMRPGDSEADQEVLRWLDMLLHHAAKRLVFEHEHEIAALLEADMEPPQPL